MVQNYIATISYNFIRFYLCSLPAFSHMSQHPPNARYPDAIALAFDERNNKLTCVYNDHSIYVWDVRDIKRVGKSHSFLYHSACIWGVEMYPAGSDCVGGMPPGCFITCSSDDTIRVWNLEKDIPPNDTLYKRNIYSNVSPFYFLFYFILVLTSYVVTLLINRNCSKFYMWIQS